MLYNVVIEMEEVSSMKELNNKGVQLSREVESVKVHGHGIVDMLLDPRMSELLTETDKKALRRILLKVESKK